MCPKEDDELLYHSVTKDADFEKYRRFYKLKTSESFVVDPEEKTAHIVEKTPLGKGTYGVVRKVPSKNMVVKEMKVSNKGQRKDAIEEHKYGKVIFKYSLFQEIKQQSLIRIGMPFINGQSLYEFTQELSTFYQLSSTFLMMLNAVQVFQESKFKKLGRRIHNDLSSVNFLVESEKNSKFPSVIHIIDLGFTRREGEQVSRWWKINRNFPPESELFSKAKTSRDIYSLGALLLPNSSAKWSMFAGKHLPAIIIENIKFIQNQMTYCDPESRINIDEVRSQFIALREQEPLLTALGADDEKEVEVILKKKQNLDLILSLVLRGQCQDTVLLLLKKHAIIPDFEEKIAAERKKIDEINIRYIGQWVVYYLEKDTTEDSSLLKVCCEEFNEKIIQ